MPLLDPEKQREFAVTVVGKLRAAGFDAYWAGGCVRDRLLGRTPKDYDVATNARPEEIRQLFTPRRTLAVGAAFGVIAVLGSKASGQIDVATFRQDVAYSDGRHPDAVEFSTPEADAQRRDFTINGLFYDPLEDRVIDFVGGQDDLARRLIRAIGDPRSRFTEDKLRLLRGVRFAATFDFAIDPATREAMMEMAPAITVVSAERIAAEMRLMLADPRRARAVELLQEVGLLAVILPELAAVDADRLAAALAILDALPPGNFPLALAALLQAFVSAAGCLEVGLRWKLANREIQRTRWLVAHRDALSGATQLAWPKLQRLLIAEDIEDLLALHAAISRARGGSPDDIDYCRERLTMPPAELNPPPLVSGDDLVAHGVKPGKRYQALLEAVRDAQLEKQIATKAEALALVDRLLAEEPGEEDT